MQKFILFLSLTLLGGVLLTGFCLAEEDYLTITTYYPSPHGSYNELQTNKLAVGDTSGNNNLDIEDQPPKNGQLYVARGIIYKPQTSPPTSNTTAGELVYDSSAKTFKHYDGSNWISEILSVYKSDGTTRLGRFIGFAGSGTTLCGKITYRDDSGNMVTLTDVDCSPPAPTPTTFHYFTTPCYYADHVSAYVPFSISPGTYVTDGVVIGTVGGTTYGIGSSYAWTRTGGICTPLVCSPSCSFQGHGIIKGVAGKCGGKECIIK